ncbi:MAG: TIGR01244 family sulfur transferase [Pseudomonadota bacterium]
MQSRKLTDDVSVAPQLTVDDVAEVAAAGFQSLICHRPDGEAPGQAEYTAIAAAAEAAGLVVHYQPVVSGRMTDVDADTFADFIRELPKPILAYCRTGTRCTALWALASAGGPMSVDEILKSAADAGYDMAALEPALEARVARSKD